MERLQLAMDPLGSLTPFSVLATRRYMSPTSSTAILHEMEKHAKDAFRVSIKFQVVTTPI